MTTAGTPTAAASPYAAARPNSQIRKCTQMERVLLIGTEDIVRAAYTIKSSADTMLHAAANVEQVFSDQRHFMDDWLIRFESVMNKATGER